MAVRLKTISMEWSDLLLQALEELAKANDVNASVNSSLIAKIMTTPIRQTTELVKSQIELSEHLGDSDFTLVALGDSDFGVLEHAVVEFAWNVIQNFGPNQHFRIKVSEFITAWESANWRFH